MLTGSSVSQKISSPGSQESRFLQQILMQGTALQPGAKSDFSTFIAASDGVN